MKNSNQSRKTQRGFKTLRITLNKLLGNFAYLGPTIEKRSLSSFMHENAGEIGWSI